MIPCLLLVKKDTCPCSIPISLNERWTCCVFYGLMRWWDSKC
jgi:hypothetical protein